MQYVFEQLIDIPMLQELMDNFFKVTGIPSGICDNASHMHTATGWKRVCTQFHRANPVTLAHCLKSDQYILEHLNEGAFIGYRCPHGLNDYAVPLWIEGEHLANVMTGQMFHEPPDLDFFGCTAWRSSGSAWKRRACSPGNGRRPPRSCARATTC